MIEDKDMAMLEDAVAHQRTSPSAPGKKAKTGGRVKGTPNKSAFYKKTVHEVCLKMGIDPIKALACFLMNLDPATQQPYQREELVGKGDNAHMETIMGFSPEIRLGAAKELASFIAPKRKAIEHSTGDKKQSTFQVITEDEAQAQEAQAKAEAEAENEPDTEEQDNEENS